MTLLSYAISIPLGIRKAMKDGPRFDSFPVPIFRYLLKDSFVECRVSCRSRVPRSNNNIRSERSKLSREATTSINLQID